LNDDLRDATEFSELERRNRARLEAFREYARAQSAPEVDTRSFDADESEQAMSAGDAEALAVHVEETERPLDLQTWRTLQRIVDDPPQRPALPITAESVADAKAEPGVTVGDVIRAEDWADVRALFQAELRRTPFA
jgi:hypothetical protein